MLPPWLIFPVAVMVAVAPEFTCFPVNRGPGVNFSEVITRDTYGRTVITDTDPMNTYACVRQHIPSPWSSDWYVRTNVTFGPDYTLTFYTAYNGFMNVGSSGGYASSNYGLKSMSSEFGVCVCPYTYTCDIPFYDGIFHAVYDGNHTAGPIECFIDLNLIMPTPPPPPPQQPTPATLSTKIAAALCVVSLLVGVAMTWVVSRYCVNKTQAPAGVYVGLQ